MPPSSTRPSPKMWSQSVTVFLNLESSFTKEFSQEHTNVKIDCVLVLGHIKFQSAVDRNSDCDYNVGGIPVTALVAWAAQQHTIDAFQAEVNTPHSEGIRARLLTAAAWLSPVEEAEVEWNDEKLKIQDRFQFIEQIRITLKQHARNHKPLDNKVLINLIHGMHASIPRGDYGIASSIVSFLQTLCGDYESPWSEDEGVLRALITYALDLLLLPARRKPLVEREIEFGKLASELIDTLTTTDINTNVIVFAFWLIYRVPHAFKSRKTLLTDIAHIWTLTNEVIPDGHRERMNFYAVDAFVAVAQFHTTANGELPKFTSHTALELLKAGLGCDYNRAMATYAIAMILNLGTSNQAATFAGGIAAESFGALLDVESDLERNAMEEDAVDLHIYSTFILLKFRAVELDVRKVKTLIGEMDRAIGDGVTRDSGVAQDSWAKVGPDVDRLEWKAIYLSTLLFAFVPEDEKQELMEGLRAKVRALLQSGGLSLADDYKRCIKPLVMDALELSTPAEKQGPTYAAFENWIDDFPLFPLTGSVTSVKT